jgi:hypothetical protein
LFHSLFRHVFQPQSIDTNDPEIAGAENVDSLNESEMCHPESYDLINYRDLTAVVCLRENVADQPLSTDLLNQIPEVLILDVHNSPLVQSELVYRKAIILGAKLKYFPFPPYVD